MCGIVGVFSDESLSPQRRGQVATALKMLSHRGPDNLKQKGFTHAILGHTRLAVVDMSQRSNQPFCSGHDNWWITWNGEIYNYQELRQELESLGHRFKTLSDTEVLLKAYIEWGDQCQQRFNGMWSLAIFNRLEQTLFLSRDRFGIKPLYWARSGNELFFSSEIKPLFCFGISRDPNWEPFRHFLRTRLLPEGGEATVFKQIYSLLPGHSMSISKNRTQKIDKWWCLHTNPGIDVSQRFEDRVQHFGCLFEDSVRLRARNDVPTAVSLSGGVDSASVYGACARLHRKGDLRCASDALENKDFRTCSVIYPGCRVNEQPWIEACLKRWNGENRYMPVTPNAEALPSELGDIVWFQEAPVWSPAIFSLHSLYRRISEAGIRVVLEGHGADEMLGGYPHLVKTALGELAATSRLSDAVTAFHCLVGMHSVPGSIVSFSKLRGVGLAFRDLGSILRQGFAIQTAGGGKARIPRNKRSFFSQEMLANGEGRDPMSESGPYDFDDALRREFTRTTLPFFLRVFDRATMAYGVESCPPFLDHRLVQFAFALPMTDKVGHLSKRILREAGRDWLPVSVRNRRGKTPFTAPVEAWFNASTVREYLWDTFNCEDALSSSFINARNVVDYLEAKRRSRFTYWDVKRLWPALNLYLWDRIVCRPSR